MLSFSSFGLSKFFQAARLAAEVPKRGLVISHNLDQVIQEVLDFIVRDYILSWYSDIAKDPHIIQKIE